MKKMGRIITVGLCPCWDVTVSGANISWGEHKVVKSVTTRPAGKALNINRALAWMNTKSIAAGLWGKADYDKMQKELLPLKRVIDIKLTPAAGSTRTNVTLLDTTAKKELHLRSVSELASKISLRKLPGSLEKIVTGSSFCVFAGSMPPICLAKETEQLVKTCAQTGAGVVVDTSGPMLRKLVDSGYVSIIKPNIDELRQLLKCNIPDTPAALKNAGEWLLHRVGLALISRGKKGAIAVTMEGTFSGRAILEGKRIVNTVGCGDYLLAGFICGLKENKGYSHALKIALKAAAARALGWAEQKAWPTAARNIKVQVRQLR